MEENLARSIQGAEDPEIPSQVYGYRPYLLAVSAAWVSEPQSAGLCAMFYRHFSLQRCIIRRQLCMVTIRLLSAEH